MRAIRFTEHGPPDVLKLVEIDAPEPGPGEVRVRHEAIGINLRDTYCRSGLYKVPLPFTAGDEAAGVVDAVGPDVDRLKAGDRVVYFGDHGAYSEANIAKAFRTVKIPDGIDAPTAAAALVKGMTAEYLLRRCYAVKPGETLLVHAAAGGVGQIMVQWAKALGATVIATVGSEAKATRVRELGADHVILYRDQDVAAEVKRITGGRGVPVAYDSVGKDTFEGTLASLSPRGLFVSYGNASGPVTPFPLSRLAQAGSVYVTRPSLFSYVTTAEEMDAGAAALFEVIRSGKVKIQIDHTYPLAEAARAHRALESRGTMGASLLVP